VVDADILWLGRETERVLTAVAPNVLRSARLRPALSQPEMDALIRTAELGPVPEDVRSLLAWHDGQDGNSSVFQESTDLGGWLLMPLTEILEQMRNARDRAHWDDAFVPFARSDSDLSVVDRRTGDVVHWWHDFEPGTICRGLRPLLINSIKAWSEAGSGERA
jgi:hypothetical protein